MKTPEIIARCKNNDPEAREVLFNLYKDQVKSIARKYCKNKADVDDILQETFIKIYLNISEYTGKGSFEGWIYRIAFNTTLAIYRKKKYIPSPEDLDTLPESYFYSDNMRDEISANSILSMIAVLPDGYKKVFTLFYNGYSHKEIAAMLSISEGTSKSQYHHAKKTLQCMVAA